MSAINISQWMKRRSQPQYWARNGQVPNAWRQQDMTMLTNQVGAYRTKEIFRSHGRIPSIGTSNGGGSTQRWRFAGHTSPLVKSIAVVFLMAQQDHGAATLDPFSSFSIDNGASTIYGTTTFHYGISGVGTSDIPSNWAYGIKILDATGFQDTDIYGGFVDNDNSRLISATVFEIGQDPDTANGYVNQATVLGGAIYDVDRSAPELAAAKAWKRQGSQVLNWNCDKDASVLTNATATHLNVIDNTSGACSAATPGYQLDMRYKTTQRRTPSVPVTMRAYGSRTGGTVNNQFVEIVDSATNTQVTGGQITGFGTSNGWQSATFNLPATDSKYDVRFWAADGTLNLYAVSAFEYET